jgi:hypothetical protein
MPWKQRIGAKCDGVFQVSFQFIPFKNDARQDDLRLYHWVQCYKDANGQTRPADDGPYSFSKYDIKVGSYKYDDIEYETVIRNHLPEPETGWSKARFLHLSCTCITAIYQQDGNATWSWAGSGSLWWHSAGGHWRLTRVLCSVKALHVILSFALFDKMQEETDYLLDMCELLDLRFILIADRWDFPAGPKRTVEDLKEHYYAIAYQLAIARAGDKALAYSNPIVRTPFDAQKERERKEFLQLSLHRSHQQVRHLLYGAWCVKQLGSLLFVSPSRVWQWQWESQQAAFAGWISFASMMMVQAEEEDIIIAQAEAILQKRKEQAAARRPQGAPLLHPSSFSNSVAELPFFDYNVMPFAPQKPGVYSRRLMLEDSAKVSFLLLAHWEYDWLGHKVLMFPLALQSLAATTKQWHTRGERDVRLSTHHVKCLSPCLWGRCRLLMLDFCTDQSLTRLWGVVDVQRAIQQVQPTQKSQKVLETVMAETAGAAMHPTMPTRAVGGMFLALYSEALQLVDLKLKATRPVVKQEEGRGKRSIKVKAQRFDDEQPGGLVPKRARSVKWDKD